MPEPEAKQRELERIEIVDLGCDHKAVAGLRGPRVERLAPEFADIGVGIVADRLLDLLQAARVVQRGQVARVAAARGLAAEQVQALVAEHTQRGPLGLGQPGVNVLTLNLALDAAQAARAD